MLYQFPDDAAGMIVLTFADHANNQFLALAAFRFDAPDDLAAAWASIPEAPGHTAFIADRWSSGQGVDADRQITAEWIERRTGKPLADLIEASRRDTEAFLGDWKAYLRKRAETRAGKH